MNAVKLRKGILAAREYVRYEVIGSQEPSFETLPDPIWLYLGSGPVVRNGYTSVDIEASHPWVIQHDITQEFPLEENSVARILTEDTLEHLEHDEIPSVLDECYRLLEEGGFIRIGVPDYNNPKDNFCIEKGYDPRHDGHKTMTHYDLMAEILVESKFDDYEFKHYWRDGIFHMTPIDYSEGFVRRTPDNDPRNHDGNALHVTSLVVDLHK